LPLRLNEIAVMFFRAVMLFFAHPEFDANINAMNSVSKDMVSADKKLQDGAIFPASAMSFCSASLAQLQQKTINWCRYWQPIFRRKMSSVVLPSLLFPSPRWAKKYGSLAKLLEQGTSGQTKAGCGCGCRGKCFASSAFEPFGKQSIIKITLRRNTGKYFNILELPKAGGIHAVELNHDR